MDVKTIAVINEAHKIYLVQQQNTNKIFIKKILDIYNRNVYETLYANPIEGTPRIIEYYEKQDQLILIEEYISGESLQDKIDRGMLTENDILQYMLDLCNILEQLHAMTPAIIHRDIKPSNIIITNYNHAVLLDFNAAKQFSDQSAADTVLLGTQGYAAPEQYGFGPSSPQTDIYALGIVLKEMAASLPNPSPVFDPIIKTCVQLNPVERYSSITVLKASLGEPKSPKQASIPPQSKRSFLPPGFRSGKPWKILVSTLGYLFIFWLCLTLKVKDTYGAALWVERIGCLFIMLSVVFCSLNYRDIQRLVPLCKHKNPAIHYLGILLLDVLMVLLLFVLMIMAETIFTF